MEAQIFLQLYDDLKQCGSLKANIFIKNSHQIATLMNKIAFIISQVFGRFLSAD